MKRVYLFIFLFSILFTACDNMEKPSDQIIVEKYELPSGTVHFPSQVPMEEFAGDSAIMGGSLILDNGCLRIDDGHYGYLVIWPPDFSFQVNDAPPAVLDENGEFIASIGDFVEVGGGEALNADFVNQHPALAETNCDGPYWVASSAFRFTEAFPQNPVIVFTPFDLADGNTLYLPTQPDTGEERGVMEALLFGTLIVDNVCLLLEDINSNTIHLPIWPPNYSLDIDEDPIAIVDENGEIRVRVGDTVHLSGGEIGNSDESEFPLKEQLCGGIYWAVGDEVRLFEE